MLWLASETLKDNFNFVHRQTDRHTNPDKPLLNCSFAVKKLKAAVGGTICTYLLDMFILLIHILCPQQYKRVNVFFIYNQQHRKLLLWQLHHKWNSKRRFNICGCRYYLICITIHNKIHSTIPWITKYLIFSMKSAWGRALLWT